MRTGAAEPDRGTHTMEGASGFCNRAHVHEYTIVDEGRYFTQPPPFTGTFLLRGPLAHVAYIVLVRGICILPLFLLSTLILNVPPVTLWALVPRSWVDSLLSTKERLTVLLSTKERLTVLLSTEERLTHFDCSRLVRDLCCSLRVRDFGLHAATRSALESVRRRRAPLDSRATTVGLRCASD